MRSTITFFFMIMAGWGFAAAGTAFSQSLTTSAEVNAVVSSSGTTPFWIRSNRSGVFSPHGSQVMARFQAHGVSDSIGPLKLHYGADLVARPGEAATLHFNQGYVKLRGWGLELAAGRFIHTSPGYNTRLGMGSLGVSGNATPVPQVRAGLVDWAAIPFTRGFVELRAHLAHGWLGSDRIMDNVLYHEKAGHLRFGGGLPLNIYGGIQHFVVWGGKNDERYGNLPSTLKDFGRIFIVQSGDENAPPGDANYMLGDHLGTIDMGFYLKLAHLNLHAYRNFPLETKNNLKLKSPQDALTGIEVTFTEPLLFGIDGIVYEFLYTKWQNGPRIEDPDNSRGYYFAGNENYYNNGVYQTGWTHNRATIGNPLFLPRADNLGIQNNRIVAHHAGVSFQTAETLRSFLKITYSRNHGNWGNPYSSEPRPFEGVPFDPPKNQLSIGAGIEAPVTFQEVPFTLLLETAYDHGTLTGNQFGILAGIRF